MCQSIIYTHMRGCFRIQSLDSCPRQCFPRYITGETKDGFRMCTETPPPPNSTGDEAYHKIIGEGQDDWSFQTLMCGLRIVILVCRGGIVPIYTSIKWQGDLLPNFSNSSCELTHYFWWVVVLYLLVYNNCWFLVGLNISWFWPFGFLSLWTPTHILPSLLLSYLTFSYLLVGFKKKIAEYKFIHPLI